MLFQVLNSASSLQVLDRGAGLSTTYMVIDVWDNMVVSASVGVLEGNESICISSSVPKRSSLGFNSFDL